MPVAKFSTLRHVPLCALTGCMRCILQGPAAAAPQRHCAQHAPARKDCCDRSQPGAVCRIAHQPDAMASCRHQCLRLFHASQVTHLAPGRTRMLTTGAFEKASQRGARVSFPRAPPSLNFQATLYKEKEHAHRFVGRAPLSFAACSFRIEAVIKILTVQWPSPMLHGMPGGMFMPPGSSAQIAFS